MSASKRAHDSLGKRVRTQLHALAGAVAFMTRLPVPVAMPGDQAGLGRATVYFPLAGVIVGFAGGIAFWAADHLWPPLIGAVISTAATVWLTGALHEDALADAADGFGGGWGREKVLAIMKDSRVGSYAVVVLTLVMIAKIGAIIAIATSDGTAGVIRGLVAAHTLGRWSGLPLLWRYPYARAGQDDGKSAPFVGGVTTPRLIAGTAMMIAIVALAVGSRAVIAIGMCMSTTAIAGRYVARRIGGITGDCLGAINQLAELGTYIILAADTSGAT